jgi:hypothetical protein
MSQRYSFCNFSLGPSPQTQVKSLRAWRGAHHREPCFAHAEEKDSGEAYRDRAYATFTPLNANNVLQSGEIELSQCSQGDRFAKSSCIPCILAYLIHASPIRIFISRTFQTRNCLLTFYDLEEYGGRKRKIR